MNTSPGRALTSSQGPGNRHQYGIVTGAVLRAVRRSIGATQADLAEALGVSLDVVAAWENGRRPLANMRVGDLHLHRRTMRRLGADQAKLSLLDQAVEADMLLAEIHHPDVPTNSHPLAMIVPDRTLTELLAWPLTGRPPRQLREDDSATRPLMASAEQAALASRLRAAADQAHTDEGGAMLRRQTQYLLAQHDDSRGWLQEALGRERRGRADLSLWTPEWSVQRSLAVAEAIRGNPEPLAHFIDEGLASDQGAAANLTYWAYWTGELRTAWTSDSQMISTDLHSWSGDRLLDSLLDSLVDSPYRDLCAHSVWALVQAKPHLIISAARRNRLLGVLDKVLSASNALSTTARERLGQVAFFARSAA